MNTIKKLYTSHLVIATLITVVVLMGLLHFLRMIPFPYEISYVFSEVVVALIIIFIIYQINGDGKLFTSTLDFGYALKLAWWPLLINILYALLSLFTYVYQGSSFLGNPFLIILGAIVLSFFVGIFEEGLFRGIVLNAFLDRLGDSRKGILMSCIYSSIIFGFVHIYQEFFGLFINPSTISWIAILQMVGKTVSVGLLGFILAVIFLRTHNLLIIAILHAINDLGPFIPDFLYENHGLTNYVSSNPLQGTVTGFFYIFQSIIILPAVFYAYKQLKQVSIPQWGFFKEPLYPISVKKNK